MELNSIWSSPLGPPLRVLADLGLRVTPLCERAVPLTANQSGKSVSSLASHLSQLPGWGAGGSMLHPSGNPGPASAVTLSLPERQTHVSSPQANALTHSAFTREPLYLLGVLPKSNRYLFSNETVARGSFTDCPSLPFSSTPPLPYPHQSDLKKMFN